MLSVRVHKAGINALKAIVIVKLILPKQGLEFKLQSHRTVNTLHLHAFNREVEVTGLTVHFIEQEI